MKTELTQDQLFAIIDQIGKEVSAMPEHFKSTEDMSVFAARLEARLINSIPQVIENN